MSQKTNGSSNLEVILGLFLRIRPEITSPTLKQTNRGYLDAER